MKVQATNVLEVPSISATTTEGSVRVPIMGILHNSVRFSDMWKDLLENHLSDIKTVIKKEAAAYYSTLSPTTLNDILSQLGSVVTGSLEVFAFICSAWRNQNARLFEDEDGYNLFTALSNITDAAAAIAPLSLGFNTPFNYDLGNATWKREYLKKLKQIYLSKGASDIIFTLFGHFIKSEDADSHEKIYCYDPFDITLAGGYNGADNTTAVTYLDGKIAVIDAAYNKYPFMDNLLSALGLVTPGENYNFTRDLAATKMKVLLDSDGALEDMIYMVSQIPNTNDVIDENKTTMYRVVRDRHLDGSYLKLYKDDKSSAESLQYQEKIFVDIASVTNAFRGNIYPLNITIVFANKTAGGKYENFFNPFILRMDAALSASAANIQIMKDLATTNNLNAVFDLGNDSVVMAIQSVGGTGELDKIATYKIDPYPTSGDYLIAADDIESVISDATFAFVFDKIEEMRATVNTLDNNGQN